VSMFYYHTGGENKKDKYEFWGYPALPCRKVARQRYRDADFLGIRFCGYP